MGDLVPMFSGKDIGVWVKERERRTLWWGRKGEYSWKWSSIRAREHDEAVTRLRATLPPVLIPRVFYAVVASAGEHRHDPQGASRDQGGRGARCDRCRNGVTP